MSKRQQLPEVSSKKFIQISNDWTQIASKKRKTSDDDNKSKESDNKQNEAEADDDFVLDFGDTPKPKISEPSKQSEIKQNGHSEKADKIATEKKTTHDKNKTKKTDELNREEVKPKHGNKLAKEVQPLPIKNKAEQSIKQDVKTDQKVKKRDKKAESLKEADQNGNSKDKYSKSMPYLINSVANRS